MQPTHATQDCLKSKARHVLAVGALLGSVAILSACGSSKPKPAPLESLTPSQKLSVVWSHRVDSVDSPVSLSVVDQSVVAGSTDGDVVAFDLNSGAEKWRGDVKTKLSAAVGSDGRYAAVVTTSNELLVLDQGMEIWRERQPGRIISAPFIAGERVFVQAVDRSVRAYDVLDGRWLWNYQRAGGEALALAVPGALTSYRDTLLVGQGARLVGLDPLRGVTRFELNLGTPRGSNEVERLADLVGPVARVGDDVCMRAFQLTVACVKASTGNLKWTRPQAGTKPVAANDQVVVAADSADRISAWKADSGDILWRVDRFTHRGLSGMAILGQWAAFADQDSYLHLIALDDGRTVARYELDAPLQAAPLVKDGLLLVQTRRGTVYALRAN